MKRTPLKRKSPLDRTALKRGESYRKPKPKVTVAGYGVIYRNDGREICDKTSAGKIEYNRRKEVMWKRQHGLCGLKISARCPVFIPLEQATFEHQDGRGMGGAKRDDRVEIDGKPYNLVACCWCNFEKGSRRLEVVIGDTSQGRG
jgi:hypothetical protein